MINEFFIMIDLGEKRSIDSCYFAKAFKSGLLFFYKADTDEPRFLPIVFVLLRDLLFLVIEA